MQLIQYWTYLGIVMSKKRSYHLGITHLLMIVVVYINHRIIPYSI